MKISNRDWIQLSSYLDGELNPRELKRIEERLELEPGLQRALEELRQAKTVLRWTPKLRVPRSFILTPAMVGIKPRPHPARGYRLVSALMTFLLVGVLVVDIGRGFISKGAMAPAAPRELMLEAASDSADDALEEPAMMEAEEPMDSDRAAAETDAIEEEVSAPAVAAEAMEEGESVGFAEEAQSKSTGEADTDTAANQADEWQEDEIAEELAVPSQTIAPDISETPIPQPPTSVYFPEEEIHSVERIPSIDPFRVLEIILGFGALIFGITAWIIRRRKS